MTNNLNLMSRRRLPPLFLHQSSKPSMPYSLKFVTKATTLESLTSFDLTPKLVKEYLDRNPEFLENYLLNNKKFRTSFKAYPDDYSILEASAHTLQTPSLKPKASSVGIMNDIVFYHEFVARLSTAQKYAPLQNRELFIHKLMDNFDELIPKASIIKCVFECMQESMAVDNIKFYLIDSKRENLYLYDPKEMNQENNATEIVSLTRINTPVAFAVAYNECVIYPNLKPSQFANLSKFKSDFNIMAQPITNFNGSVYGAVELYRERHKTQFVKTDEEVVLNYITWSSITLYFSEILSNNNQQQQLNSIIMRVTQTMFTNFRHMDNVIMDIMRYAKHIVKAQRSAFFVVEKETQDVLAKIFDVGNEFETQFVADKEKIRFPIGVGVVGHVAATGQALNIKEAYSDIRFNRDIDILTGYHTKSLLAIPIKLKNEVVGVLQLVNKMNGPFNKRDEENLGTFGTYCGIALYISKMYQSIKHSEQKYKVALGVLSYHGGYDQSEYAALSAMTMPKEWLELQDFFLSPWDLQELKQLMAFIYMFHDLFGIYSYGDHETNFMHTRFDCSAYRFDKETLMKFILTVKKNYRKVPYHNWTHAFSVGHAMYCILVRTSHQFTAMESLALFISCFCHDLDHRGRTNEYINKSDNALGSLYSTSTMEHHHFNMTVQILQRDNHNIFENMISTDYKIVLDLIRSNILATDLNSFFPIVKKVSGLIKNNEIDWNNYDHRIMIMDLCMTASDLCAMFKPWEKQLSYVRVIMEEFWEQGDLEKERGEVPARMMDRDYRYELADLEIGFIVYICCPCYNALDSIMTGFTEVVQGLESNLAQWKVIKTLPKEEFIKMFS